MGGWQTLLPCCDINDVINILQLQKSSHNDVKVTSSIRHSTKVQSTPGDTPQFLWNQVYDVIGTGA